MRRLTPVLAILLTLLCACSAGTRPDSSRILFVGNSLTYVGNLPAVLEALASDNRKALRADLIVKGGATLTQRVEDGSVQRALDAEHYDFVVLQERGGDFLCDFGPQSCESAKASLATLADVVRAHGSRPMLLGTYQTLPAASDGIVSAESEAATNTSVPYVSVSNKLRVGMRSFGDADWLYADGMHPGHDLVLLDAVLLYRQIFGELPSARPLAVSAPMYAPSTKFSAPDPTCFASKGESPQGHTYSGQALTHAIALTQQR